MRTSLVPCAFRSISAEVPSTGPYLLVWDKLVFKDSRLGVHTKGHWV